MPSVTQYVMSQHNVNVNEMFGEWGREELATAIEWYSTGYLRANGIDDPDLDYEGSADDGEIVPQSPAVQAARVISETIRTGGDLEVTDEKNDVAVALRALDYNAYDALKEFMRDEPAPNKAEKDLSDSDSRLMLYQKIQMYEVLADEAADRGLADRPTIDTEVLD